VLGDSAYGTGELRRHLADRDMTAVIKPPPLRPAVEGGYTLDDFTINEAAGTVTCPAAVTVQITARRRARFGRHCGDCPLRGRCTTAARGRVIVLHSHHGLLAAARALTTTGTFTHTYRRHRPMVERSIAWLVRSRRRLRYRGIARNRLWLGHRVAAINLQRLVNLGLTHRANTWAIP
jgi:Transposase DDE domain